MKRVKEKNTAMVIISAIVLVVTNLGIWLAVKEGAMAPVENNVLWGVFVALNVASILWAIVLLGLQPMVVSLSYLAGGFLAFKGVEGLSDISVAEVTTAGATYGAFGALAVGNMTTKVRLAFYNKKQVPFIFIIVGLLVVDAVLNSGVSSAGGRVILNAMVFPFVLAGVIFGLIWAVLNHFGIGDNPHEAVALAEVQTEEASAEAEDAAPPENEPVLRFQVPEDVEEPAEEVAAVLSEAVVEQELPRESVDMEPVQEAAAATESKEEEFFPLEIDNNDEFVVPLEDTESPSEATYAADDSEDPLSISNFDSTLYESGAVDDFQNEEPIPELAASEPVYADFAEEIASADDVMTAAAEEYHEPEPLAPVEEYHEPEPIIAAEELREPEPAVAAEEYHEPEPVAPVEEYHEPEPIIAAEELREPEPVVAAEEHHEPEPLAPVEAHHEPEPIIAAEEPREPEPPATAENDSERPAAEKVPGKQDQSGDWLSGHLDLLNKLK